MGVVLKLSLFQGRTELVLKSDQAQTTEFTGGLEVFGRNPPIFGSFASLAFLSKAVSLLSVRTIGRG